MAQWRPLHRRITSSDKVVELASDPFALWLYCGLLPHTDSAGRINGNPAGLAGTIFEGFGYTAEQIEAALVALARVGLIHLYANGRNKFLVEFTKFAEMCRPDKREARSELPGPSDEGSESVTDAPAESSRNLPEEPPENPRLHVHVHVHEHEQELSADADETPQEKVTLATLVEVWNDQAGDLRKVRDLDAANRNPELNRLTNAFLRRHGPEKAVAIFTAGIAAVRVDPHWLGNRASPVKRSGAPYGLLNYLRHVEDKAEEAAELARPSPPHRSRPTRPLEQWDIVEHIPTGVLGTIHEILPGNLLRINNGETWPASEVERCSN